MRHLEEHIDNDEQVVECFDPQCDGNHSAEGDPQYDSGYHPPMAEQGEQSCDYVCPDSECEHCSCAHEQTGLVQPNCADCRCDGSALRALQREQVEARRG